MQKNQVFGILFVINKRQDIFVMTLQMTKEKNKEQQQQKPLQRFVITKMRKDLMKLNNTLSRLAYSVG